MSNVDHESNAGGESPLNTNRSSEAGSLDSPAPDLERSSMRFGKSSLRLEGHLEKQGEWFSSFKPRYVKLYNEGVFAHYLTEEDQKPRARQSLAGATVAAVDGSEAGSFPFVVKLPGGKLLSLRCATHEERTEWVSAIAECATTATAAFAEEKAKADAAKADAEKAKKEADAARRASKSPAKPTPTKPTNAAVTIVEPPPSAAPAIPKLGGAAQAAQAVQASAGFDQPQLTSRSKSVMSAEMAKAMGGELEAVQQQTQAAQARVTEAQAALQQRTEELEAVRAEKQTKTAALAAQLDALAGASRGLTGYEEQIASLEASSNATSTSTASLEQSARGVQARLKAEAKEASERLDQRAASLSTLEAAHVGATTEAAAARAAAEQAHLSAKREVSATSTLLKLQSAQRQLIKEKLQSAEHEHGLAAKVLEGKQKLLAAATAEQASLQQALTAAEKVASELAEREAVLLKADGATSERVRSSNEQLAAAEGTVRRLVEMAADYQRSEAGSTVREVLEGEADTLSAEIEAAEAAVRTLAAQQTEAAEAEATGREERQAELRQLRAEQVAAQAVHERKAAHAAQQKGTARELEAEALKWSHAAAEHAECVRVLSAEVEAQTKRESELQAALRAAEARVQEKGAAAVRLGGELDEAENARKLEIDSERRVLTQQQAYLQQLQASVVDDSALSKEGTALVAELISKASSTAAARRSRLETARGGAEAELEEVEQRLRSQEGAANAEVSAASEMVEAQQKELLQLQAHEKAFRMSTSPPPPLN